MKKKKIYHAPKLDTHGTVWQLTQAKAFGFIDGSAHSQSGNEGGSVIQGPPPGPHNH